MKLKNIREKFLVIKKRYSFKAIFKCIEFLALMLQIIQAIFGDEAVRKLVEIISKILGMN